MKKVEIIDEKEKAAREFKKDRVGEVLVLTQKNHPGEEGKNLLAFSSYVFDAITDYHFIQGLNAENLYRMVLNYFEFISGDLSPLDERFPDLPRAAIRVFNPSEAPQCQDLVRHLELDATLIQVHVQDGPFIFESISNCLKKKGLRIFNAIHPVISLTRKEGKIEAIHEGPGQGERSAFVNIYIEKIVNPKNLRKIEGDILSVLKALFLAIADFRPMLAAVGDLLSPDKPPTGMEGLKKTTPEEAAFLKWLVEENFIFMGIRRYAVQKGKKNILVSDGAPPLGVFRDTTLMETVFPGQMAEVEGRLAHVGHRDTVSVEFFNTCASTIYHFDPIDLIIVTHAAEGKTEAKTALFGRFSRGAKFQKSTHVPLLREKVSRILDSGGKKYSAYFRREYLTTFNQFPKRELFYLNTDELRDLIGRILSVQSDENVEVFVKKDPLDSYLICFVILSRAKYSRPIRERVKALLAERLNRPLTRWEAVDCFSNTLLVFYLDTRKGKRLSVDVGALESAIQGIISTWDDRLTRRLVQEHKDRAGFALYNKYKAAFSSLYKEITNIEEALADIQHLERLERTKLPCIHIFPSSPNEVEVKLYSHAEIDLMAIIPTAQNLGLYVTSEQVLPLRVHEEATAYIHIFKVSGEESFLNNMLEKRHLLSEIFLKLMDGRTVNDRLNELVLKAGFNWKGVELFRTLKCYLLQIDSSCSPNSIDEALIKFVDITKNLFLYFETKFKPQKKEGKDHRKKSLETQEQKFLDSLTQVSSLAEDQIFRGIFDIAKNSLRTNFYIDPEKNCISIKIDCRAIAKMPSPRPLYEIYVHSPELEGVHLRGGKVARGGLRWSDRYDDFRTEILGLMKTQMLKNSVIVPVGSKGGFVLRRREFKDAREREVYLKEQYQTFIAGLLDITDDIRAGEPVFPAQVVHYDKHDPYLVVAADKGTAKLSDAANEVSGKYGFWLGDAFASGGAVGYDHKKEAITARGAWECVKRHFRERGTNIQEETIRVAGIGDMAGDVFGNGMLLSKKIKLVAAFNHAHIFLDPDPNPEKSWEERKRLFDNPRLTWMDYSRDLLSPGGGIYARSSKSIALSPEARQMLGLSKDAVNGEELIRAILSMEVDLLWNGGIGTYIKASAESHLDVGDRSNDRVRVDAKDLRCRVLGEGGNLGVTQLGRIEAARQGIAGNTDAIDNSGGVDMSDHEVNLKILLGTLMDKGELKSKEERNELFARVTHEVAEHVLKDNYLQSAVISMDRLRSARKADPYLDLIEHLVSLKILNRKEEFFPQREDLQELAAGQGIPRPILAVLLGYAKIHVSQQLLVSSLMGTVFAERYLFGYFPEIFRRDFVSHIQTHRLRKEIISTVIANKIVNQAGMAFFNLMREKTGKEIWEIARAYIIIENMLSADDFRRQVHALDNQVSSPLQYQMLLQMENILFHLTKWMLTYLALDRVGFDMIDLYQGVIVNFRKNLVANLETVCSLEKGCLDREARILTDQNVPRELAETMAILPYLKDVMAILKIKEGLHVNFIDAGNLYIKLTNYLCLDWIETSLEELELTDPWEEEAAENLHEELKEFQDRITAQILNFKQQEESIDEGFHNYIRENEEADRLYRKRVEEIKTSGKKTLVAFGVLVRSLKAFQ